MPNRIEVSQNIEQLENDGIVSTNEDGEIITTMKWAAMCDLLGGQDSGNYKTPDELRSCDKYHHLMRTVANRK